MGGQDLQESLQALVFTFSPALGPPGSQNTTSARGQGLLGGKADKRGMPVALLIEMSFSPWIHSSALFAECTYCRLPHCISCRFEHQTSHQQAVVILRSVVHQFDVNDETEVCAKCSGRVSFCYTCCECKYALCRSCWFEKDINMHQHKIFNVIEPPRLVKSKSGVKDMCCAVPTVNHCSTCSAAFSVGQETIFCKTCYLDSNELVYLCVRCYISSEQSHPRYHESWQWTVEMAKPGGLARGIHCNECLQTIKSAEDLKVHPHTSYADVYSEKHLNQVIAQSYRQCQRKAGRVDEMMAGASERCTMCLQKTVSTSFLPCRQCNEVHTLCAHCEQHASKLHTHELPVGDSHGSSRPSNATVVQSKSMDSNPRSSALLQPPQSRNNVETRPSPVPSPVPSPISSANHLSPSVSPNCAIEPPWTHFYDENEAYYMYEAGQYSLQQGQNLPHPRSMSDPTVALPRSRSPSASPQPYPKGPPPSKPTQGTQQKQPGQRSQPASPQPKATGPAHRMPKQPTQNLRSLSGTPPSLLQPDPCRPSHNGPPQSLQARQSPYSGPPTPPTSPQSIPARPLHSKPIQSASPSQSLQSAHLIPQISHQPNPACAPSSRPAQLSTLAHHPQPAIRTKSEKPTADPIARLNSAPQILVSTPQHPQEDSVPQTKRNRFAGIKKAYDATQENAAGRFATRLVAKTAFGAISNAIGADVGGLIDGVGGMSVGGTGIDVGNIVGNAVTSAADSAFEEAMGEDGPVSQGGSRWKNSRPKFLGR